MDYIQNNIIDHIFNEEQISIIISQILYVINYLESKGIFIKNFKLKKKNQL